MSRFRGELALGQASGRSVRIVVLAEIGTGGVTNLQIRCPGSKTHARFAGLREALPLTLADFMELLSQLRDEKGTQSGTKSSSKIKKGNPMGNRKSHGDTAFC